MHNYKAIDFFCGAGGMTTGFKKAGIDVIAGIDFDEECEKTYTVNNPDSKFIKADIKTLSFDELRTKVGIDKNNDFLIFIGCSPCQYWSKINTDKKKSEESKNLLVDFQRFVDFYNPGYIVIENVPGIANKKQSTPLNSFLGFLNQKGYVYDMDIINFCNYGIPQTRKRFLLIASRVRKDIRLPYPKPDHIVTVRDCIVSFPYMGASEK